MEHSFDNDSWIKHVNYDDESKYMMVSTEKGQYELAGVSLEIFQQFEKSPSRGSYFNRNLKGQYDNKIFNP